MAAKKRSFFEIALVTVVVALALALGVGLYAGRAKVQKSRLLIQELSILRSSISLYKMMNREFPESLNELADSKYEFDNVPRPYLEKVHRSDIGDIVDPFGNPYSYNPNTGWVRSTTKGYTRW